MIFQIGDFVKIKRGVFNAGYGKWDLTDWQGWIVDWDDDGRFCYDILWDIDTIRNMSLVYLQRYIANGDVYELHRVYEDDIELSESVLTQEESEELAEKWRSKHKFNDGTAIGNIISMVLEGEESETEAFNKWFDYLNTHLTYPFFCRIKESDNRLIRIGEKVSVLGILEKSGNKAITMDIKWRGQKRPYSLYDLEIVDKKSDNGKFLEAYYVWYEHDDYAPYIIKP